jgi:homoserine O-acetyltransferase
MQIPEKYNLRTSSFIQPNADYFYISDHVFRNGKHLSDFKIHYYTLGSPKKNEQGEIVNAVLLLHWTAASGQSFLSQPFMSSLYAPGKPLDVTKYFIIIPDNIGHGHSSKPSDGLRMEFPEYGYLDMVDLQYKLLTEKLGLKHLKMVLGTSMGGMQTWLWTELYPNFMDGAIPIASQPTKLIGRCLLWKHMLTEAIKNDPEWNNGNYKVQPQGFLGCWPFARILLDGVPHLYEHITNEELSLQFVKDASLDASKKDATDVLYALEASKDYDPESNLDKIKTKVLALNFTDDQIYPLEVSTLNTIIQRIKNGRAIILEGTINSYGHLSMVHPELWADHLREFISQNPELQIDE